MKNFKNVFLFEYLTSVKPKSFLITCLILVVVSVGAVFLPGILDFFSGTFGGDNNSQTTVAIAVVDDTGLFSDELLHQHMNVAITRYTDMETVTNSVETGQYAIGLHFLTPTEYVVVFETNLTGPVYQNTIHQMVMAQYVTQQFGEIGTAVLATNITSHVVAVGGGGFFVGYALAFALFMLTNFFAAGIGVEVVNEKSTKIIELLFTSAAPTVIIIGKVAAYIAVLVTMMATMIVPYMIASQFTETTALTHFFSAEIWAVFSPLVVTALILFALMSFVTILFLYAMFSATVKDAQEATQVQWIPSLIAAGGFMLSIFGVAANPDWMTPALLDAIGFIPVIAPINMIVRMTSLSAPDGYIIASLVANFVYLLLIAVLASRLYAKFIVYNGSQPFRNFFKLKNG